MDKARAKVGEFLHKSGNHDTHVHESVKPAVTHETVKPHEHEQNTTAIDREIHQDHHHTSVQPIHDRNVLPEQHHHREGQVESRDFRHGNDDSVSGKLDQERSKFRDHTTTGPTTSTQQSEPTVTGEHVHHNVHEVIQPVVHRETVEPHVVHSVNKVHEKHDKPAQVHETSTLPAMNMSDFTGQGGSLSGRETRTDAFGGEPHHIGGNTASGTGHTGHGSGVPGTGTGTGHTGHGTGHTTGGVGTGTGTGIGHSEHGTGPHTGHTTGGVGTGTGTGTGIGHSGHGSRAPHTGAGTAGGVPHSTGAVTSSGVPSQSTGPNTRSAGKPSLMDKLNPKKDADGDGKPGVFS